MRKTTKRRKVLRFLGCGCASVVLIVLGFALWVGLQIRAMNAPVEMTEHHPFKSAAKKVRYLGHYDARATSWPVASETLFVDTSWGQTFVRVSGPAGGPALVLLPGANATGLMFQPNVEAWAENHRVFAVDTIFDFGRSVYVRNLKTPADFVDWLDQLLDGLGLTGRVDLLGVSYGGWIASQYGLARPERLDHLVLVAPAATIAQFSMDFIKKGILCGIPHPYFIEDMVAWAMPDAANGTSEQQWFAQMAADNAWLGLRGFKPKQMVHPTILTDEEWRSFEVPVLFLVGENERIWEISGEQAVARLHAVAPEIEAELFPDCGHDITVVQTERLNRRVLDFLEAIP